MYGTSSSLQCLTLHIFFFQAEDGIRDLTVTGVQTCALPIYPVEYPRSIAGVRLALLFRQIANGRVKVSFRSMGGVDVADLAHPFGGGGHKKAAGASFEGAIADVQEKVLAAARDYLRAHPA